MAVACKPSCFTWSPAQQCTDLPLVRRRPSHQEGLLVHTRAPSQKPHGPTPRQNHLCSLCRPVCLAIALVKALLPQHPLQALSLANCAAWEVCMRVTLAAMLCTAQSCRCNCMFRVSAGQHSRSAKHVAVHQGHAVMFPQSMRHRVPHLGKHPAVQSMHMHKTA